jgi:anti-anti-sigma factor
MAERTARVFEVERTGETLVMAPPRGLPKLDCRDGQEWACKALAAINGNPAKNVVVDLQGADHIGPAVLRLYLQVWKGVRDRDGRMVLCNVSHEDRDMLCATHLNSVWTVYPTREKALEGVKGES